ncbi:uncharacterized protein P884DRAFT_265817 [Thermothelomyces heterothallicus CBS 202.75]|uniref:uncharacterized protein n=1 Tax=Thermothelomyces heterothallicus CBS 202.75 TaxID=1149848 RepID=UPI00374321E1
MEEKYKPRRGRCSAEIRIKRQCGYASFGLGASQWIMIVPSIVGTRQRTKAERLTCHDPGLVVACTTPYWHDGPKEEHTCCFLLYQAPMATLARNCTISSVSGPLSPILLLHMQGGYLGSADKLMDDSRAEPSPRRPKTWHFVDAATQSANGFFPVASLVGGLFTKVDRRCCCTRQRSWTTDVPSHRRKHPNGGWPSTWRPVRVPKDPGGVSVGILCTGSQSV